jgi:hypothetical protein
VSPSYFRTNVFRGNVLPSSKEVISALALLCVREREREKEKE